MRIILCPTGGLANRMRAIDSAYNLSIEQNFKLTVFWIKDKGLNCDYSSVFSSNPFIHDTNGRILKIFFYLDRKFWLIKFFNKFLERIHLLKIFLEDDYKYIPEFATNKNSRFCLILIKSFSAFFPARNFHSELFKPLPDIEKLIHSETDCFKKNTIGVHIRRGDNIDSIVHSPLELFEKRMNQELKECPDTFFYLTSDDSYTKNYFEQSEKWKGRVIMPKGIISRNSADGIIQAVIELFALSRTNKIIGSHWSSYSEMASMLGKIKLEIVKR